MAMTNGKAQELNCTVKLSHAQIQGTNTQVFTTLENALREFVNNRRWTAAQYEPAERIRCAMTFNVKSYNEEEARWTCELTVQSSRPVWQSAYQTTLFAFKDNDVSFSYREFDPLELQDNVLSNNLTAIVAYYAYLIIGLDMDSMAPQGGSNALRAAEQIVTAAQTIGEVGWTAFDSRRNRHALITDYLEEPLSPLRAWMYNYYRLGMDELSTNAPRARAAITAALSDLQKAHQAKPLSILPGLFTEIKKDELIHLYTPAAADERKEVATLLTAVNPSLSNEWKKL
jgi:hypothetical protein